MSQNSTFDLKPTVIFNFSNTDPNELCELALSFRNHSRFIIMLSIQVFLSLLTLATIYFLLINRELRKFWSLITLDLKIIIMIGFFFYIASSFNIFIMGIYKTYLLLFDSSLCPIWDGWSCYYAQRFYSTSFIRSYNLVHFGLLFERFCVSIFKQRHCPGLIGCGLVVIAVVTTPLPHIFLINKGFYETPRVYCGNPIIVVDKNLQIANYSYIFIDVMITFGDFLLYIKNKREIDAHKSIMQSVSYCLQMYALVIYLNNAPLLSLKDENFAYEIVNFSRILANLTLLSFLWSYNRYQSQSKSLQIRDTNAAEEHFKELRRIIS